MDKDINDYTYGDLQGDIKLKSFIEHSTPAEIDISGIKKKAFLKMLNMNVNLGSDAF